MLCNGTDANCYYICFLTVGIVGAAIITEIVNAKRDARSCVHNAPRITNENPPERD